MFMKKTNKEKTDDKKEKADQREDENKKKTGQKEMKIFKRQQAGVASYVNEKLFSNRCNTTKIMNIYRIFRQSN